MSAQMNGFDFDCNKESAAESSTELRGAIGERVLDALLVDAPRTSDELARITGYTPLQCINAVYALRKKGLVRSERTTRDGSMIYLNWRIENPLPIRKREPVKGARTVLPAATKEDAVDRLLRGMAMCDDGRKLMFDAMAELETGLNDVAWLADRLKRVAGGAA